MFFGFQLERRYFFGSGMGTSSEEVAAVVACRLGSRGVEEPSAQTCKAFEAVPTLVDSWKKICGSFVSSHQPQRCLTTVSPESSIAVVVGFKFFVSGSS